MKIIKSLWSFAVAQGNMYFAIFSHSVSDGLRMLSLASCPAYVYIFLHCQLSGSILVK